MSSSPAPSALRCLLVWLLSGGLVIGAAGWLGPGLTALGPHAPFPALIAAIADGAVIACATWAWLVTTVVVAETAPWARTPRVASHRTRGSQAVPPWARRLVGAACGIALLAPAPALASQGQSDHSGGASLLAGLPLPDRATGGELPPPAHRLGRAVAEVAVGPGDSLWSIATTHLGPSATTDRVAALVSALYRLNRVVIGADPDLIHPGQHLRVPLDVERPHR